MIRAGSSSWSITRDPLLELVDLGGELQGKSCFDGDVVGQVAVVDVIGPQRECLIGDVQQPVGVGLAPGAAGVPPEELDQPAPAKPAQRVRIGVAGGQEPQRCVVGQIGAEGGMPAGSEKLQIGVEAGQALRCAA